MRSLRLAFMGTPDFSVSILAALLKAGHRVVAVYAQPPRPAGRGHKAVPTPVHRFAQEQGLPVLTPVSLKGAEEQAAFAALDLDFAVVAAYGLILPPAVLEAPRWGCLNVHASLLPRWRGAAPIQRALLAGDRETGISIMQMDAGLDTGAVLSRTSLSLSNRTTTSELHDRLAEMGAEAIVAALEQYDHLTPEPQPNEGVTYAAKLKREEGRIQWSDSAEVIERQIRALAPGVWCEAQGERLKLLAAEVVEGQASAPPGTLLDEALTIACGERALRPTRVQRAGKAPLAASELLRGFPLPRGTRLL